ncbi:MAG: prepilin-type N-terminal cleavage/methylation domain-containing protein [Deltaproteobacteria bacterium]|nr:prepilin-type N-terminal cleavage/methylation domain-containing protein [Deltaproteobacteria bacterium]
MNHTMNTKGLIEKNEGFTLVEVIMAMLIVLFGFLAVSMMQIMAIKNNANISQKTEALNLAQDRMEDIKRNALDHFAELVNGGDSQGQYTRSWTVTPLNSITKQVVVTVTCPGGKSYKLQTNISNFKYDVS